MTNEPRDIEKTPYELVRPASPDAAPLDAPVHRKRSHWEKLGVYNLSVLIVGTIVIGSAVGFLSYVWIYSVRYLKDGTTRSPLWFTIVSRYWTSRVLTLTTVVIRVTVGAQLTVFAALMAAVILERIGASAKDLPLLSMIRCSNTGPQALIWNIVHSIPKRSQFGYSLLIIVMILNGLILQFMSTILLADFGVSMVVVKQPDWMCKVAWGINGTEGVQGRDGSDYWKSTQASYPPFAEYKEVASEGANFMDTGKVYRGFLSTSNATLRENIKSYEGPMTVLDERVVCVKPTLTDAVFHIPAHSDDTMTAKLTFNNTHADVTQLKADIKFSCTMPHYWTEHNVSYAYTSICRLDSDLAILKGGLNNDTSASPWLIFNVTAPETFKDNDWLQMVVDPEETVNIPLGTVASANGPWTKVSHPNLTVDATLCLTNTKADIYQVEASTTAFSFVGDHRIYWDSKAGRYDTSSLRMQLDAFGHEEFLLLQHGYASAKLNDLKDRNETPPEIRGVMNLRNVPDWGARRIRANSSDAVWDSIHGSLNKVKPWDYNGTTNDSFIMTPRAGVQDAPHRSYVWLMQDILNTTQNPAKAIQAVTHMVMQTAYYDWLDTHDLRANATCYATEQRFLPWGYQQLMIVGGLLGFHLILLAGALFLFFMKTEISLLGNAWQAVAQVISNDTAAAVQHGTMATDQEVIQSVKQSGMDRSHVVIRRSVNNGRLEAVAVNPDR